MHFKEQVIGGGGGDGGGRLLIRVILEEQIPRASSGLGECLTPAV